MNISFLNSFVLWFLPAVLIPLIIHFLSKRNQPKIYFSDLRFIKMALDKVHSSSKIRKYLLLFIRMLIIFFLVLYFAKPVWQAGTFINNSKDSNLAVVLLIDASYSMEYNETGKTKIDKMKLSACRIVDLFPDKTKIGIIAYSDKVESVTPVLSNDKNYLKKMIKDIKISNRPTDINVTFQSMEQMFNKIHDSSKAVIVFSDMAAHGFKKKFLPVDKNIKIITFNQQQAANAWIENIKPVYDDIEKRWQFETSIRSKPIKSMQQFLVSISAGEKKIGSDFFKLQNSEQLLQVASTSCRDSKLCGKAELYQDNLAKDNVRYFCADKPIACETIIIDGDPKFGGSAAESFYLRSIFPDAEVLSEDELDKISQYKPQLIILANLRNDNSLIEKYISSGCGALIFLGEHSLENFDYPYFPAVVSSKFETVQTPAWAEAGHKIMNELNLYNFEWQKIVIQKGFVLQPKKDAVVLAALSSGQPFLVEGKYGAGKVVLCASTADRDWNNFVSKPLYAPFMHAMARYLSNTIDKQKSVSLFAGESFRYLTASSGEIVVPSGSKIKVSNTNGTLIFSGTNETGIYKLILDGREAEKFAVNLNTLSGESDLTLVNAAQLKEFFPENQIATISLENFENEILSILTGKDITRYMLLIVFLLILAEIILSSYNKRPKI